MSACRRRSSRKAGERAPITSFNSTTVTPPPPCLGGASRRTRPPSGCCCRKPAMRPLQLARCRSRESPARALIGQERLVQEAAPRASSASSTVQPITFRSAERPVARLQVDVHAHRAVAAPARLPGRAARSATRRACACRARRAPPCRRAMAVTTPSRPKPPTITRSPTTAGRGRRRLGRRTAGRFDAALDALRAASLEWPACACRRAAPASPSP